MSRFSALPSPSAILLLGVCLLVPALSEAQVQEGLGLYRFPDLHGSTVVFAAEGDLWTVSSTGGVAQRLTTHPGEERYPRVSPDGRTLAFSAQYEGPTEVYTMPLTGGLPVRRTYESEASVATTWTPDGRLVYCRECPDATVRNGVLVPVCLALCTDGGGARRSTTC